MTVDSYRSMRQKEYRLAIRYMDCPSCGAPAGCQCKWNHRQKRWPKAEQIPHNRRVEAMRSLRRVARAL